MSQGAGGRIDFITVLTCAQTLRGRVPYREREAAMADYRAYMIGDDGRFMRAVELVCPDDEAATEQAKQLVDGHDVELWSGPRLVVRLKKTDDRN
jgi:hypothetical protein